MPDDKNILLKEFRSRPFSYTVQVVGVIVVVLNVWLGTKLFPLAKNIDSLVVKVEALEKERDIFKQDTINDNQMLVEIKTMSVTLDEVKARLERVDTRLSKHLGI